MSVLLPKFSSTANMSKVPKVPVVCLNLTTTDRSQAVNTPMTQALERALKNIEASDTVPIGDRLKLALTLLKEAPKAYSASDALGQIELALRKVETKLTDKNDPKQLRLQGFSQVMLQLDAERLKPRYYALFTHHMVALDFDGAIKMFNKKRDFKPIKGKWCVEEQPLFEKQGAKTLKNQALKWIYYPMLGLLKSTLIVLGQADLAKQWLSPLATGDAFQKELK